MKTGTQNRSYDATSRLLVRATFVYPDGKSYSWEFDWNNRESVRVFAADSDRAIRAGAKSILESVS